MSDKAETWFQDRSSHDLGGPVKIWEKTHMSGRREDCCIRVGCVGGRCRIWMSRLTRCEVLVSM